MGTVRRLRMKHAAWAAVAKEALALYRRGKLNRRT
jgi:hypothetical protein